MTTVRDVTWRVFVTTSFDTDLAVVQKASATVGQLKGAPSGTLFDMPAIQCY